MPKDYFNPPVAAATGQNHKISPQALMFERLISELQSTLEEEVFFDDSDWPDGFDWMGEAEAVWEGLAEALSGCRRRNVIVARCHVKFV
ncbi:hypothetical protein A3753_19465 [Sulfitobacter sp. HI0082]|nr:hypothetical protein A3753_19465 [Sulfitobacter sp. HI0082]